MNWEVIMSIMCLITFNYCLDTDNYISPLGRAENSSEELLPSFFHDVYIVVNIIYNKPNYSDHMTLVRLYCMHAMQ